MTSFEAPLSEVGCNRIELPLVVQGQLFRRQSVMFVVISFGNL